MSNNFRLSPRKTENQPVQENGHSTTNLVADTRLVPRFAELSPASSKANQITPEKHMPVPVKASYRRSAPGMRLLLQYTKGRNDSMTQANLVCCRTSNSPWNDSAALIRGALKLATRIGLK